MLSKVLIPSAGILALLSVVSFQAYAEEKELIRFGILFGGLILSLVLVFVSPATGSAVTEIGAGQYKNKLLKLPKFLINEKFDHDNEDVIDGLNLAEFFFDKWFYKPNNLNFPESRNRLKDMFIK